MKIPPKDFRRSPSARYNAGKAERASVTILSFAVIAMSRPVLPASITGGRRMLKRNPALLMAGNTDSGHYPGTGATSARHSAGPALRRDRNYDAPARFMTLTARSEL